jgi:hypothetical protein
MPQPAAASNKAHDEASEGTETDKPTRLAGSVQIGPAPKPGAWSAVLNPEECAMFEVR